MRLDYDMDRQPKECLRYFTPYFNSDWFSIACGGHFLLSSPRPGQKDFSFVPRDYGSFFHPVVSLVPCLYVAFISSKYHTLVGGLFSMCFTKALILPVQHPVCVNLACSVDGAHFLN
ncbi:hypothetical protein OCU04_011140 [Sclerotinia nivalis]|uniref:Uncharacterized protein n=1 Tax=Sclerotinia nivalis TaxID=352851 RepID=A0A9X0DE59_9HELO|nr:hypothetical protein OCU04_011140 [Sclerotinia nivalis]